MFENFDNNNRLDDFDKEGASFLDEEMEARKQDMNRSKNILIGTVSGLVIASVVAWFVLSPKYAGQEDVEIPVVKRPVAEAKTEPLEPGGLEVLNQDKSIYDVIENSVSEEIKVEQVAPVAEELVLPQMVAEDVQEVKPEPATDVAPLEVKVEAQTMSAQELAEIVDLPKAEEPVKAEVVAEPTKVEEPAKAEVVVEPTKVEEPAKAEVVAEPTKVEEVKAQEVKEEVKDAPKDPNATVFSASTKPVETQGVAKGKWQVQIISSPNKNLVEQNKKTLVKKYPLLKDYVMEVQEADLGAKGIYYRLKAGAFNTRSEATLLCNDLKALGAGCLVKQK